MKKIKKLCAVIISICMIVSVIPHTFAAQSSIESVEQVSEEEGRIIYDVTLSQSGTLITAVYNENGLLVNMDTENVESGSVTRTIDTAGMESGTAKFMLWNTLDDMEPISDSVEKQWSLSDIENTPSPTETIPAVETPGPTQGDHEYNEPELSDLSLWYDEPAAEDDSECWTQYDAVKVTDRYKETHLVWKQKALPIGNGYQGAMIFGGVSQERIQLNEKTLWEGEPEHVETDKSEAFRNARDAMLEGDDGKALSYAEGMAGSTKNYGTYTVFGNLSIDFTNIPSGAEYTDYIRGLDLENSRQITAYTVDGIRYCREYFASYPDRAMFTRISADHEGSVSFKMSFTNQPNSSKDIETSFEDGTLKVSGALNDNGMRWAGEFRIETSGGTVSFDETTGEVFVNGADSAVIKTALATDYDPDEAEGYRTGIAPIEVTDEIISKVADKAFDEIYEKHLADYRSIFDNVSLELNANNDMPTDEMMEANRNGMSNIMLDELFYQYGRYMLISSSRAGSLPANLEGVWNDMREPAWYSDYHININLQMNYYPAANGNMLECMEPLIDFVERTMESGKLTAKNIYGCSGWVSHHMNNPFGFTDIDPSALTAALSPESSAWIALSCWDLYDYSQDEEYLPRIYNIIQEAVRFYSEYLYYDAETDEYIAGPSYSPEQTDVFSMGAKIAQQLIKSLYEVYLEASEISAVSDMKDDALVETVKEQVDKLQTPVEIGSWGNIMEWNTYQGAALEEESSHRHISHLVALYPLDQITRRTPELLRAARTTLNARGDEATGWSRANKILLWARAIGQDSDSASTVRGDSYIQDVSNADRAYSIYQGLIQDMVYDNFFDWHPLGSDTSGRMGVFQIDGNLGTTAAMGEFLLQSHDGYLDILPSLPTAWSDGGSVDGLLGRGGYTVDIDWKYGRPTETVINSVKSGECKVYNNDEYGDVTITVDGESVDYELVNEDGLSLIVFDAEAGRDYRFSYSLEGAESDVTLEKNNTSDAVHSVTEDEVIVMDGTAVSELINGVHTELGGAAAFEITDSKGTVLYDDDILTSGAVLTVTSENGEFTKAYDIKIMYSELWDLRTIFAEKTTMDTVEGNFVEFNGLEIHASDNANDYIDTSIGLHINGKSSTGSDANRYIKYTPERDTTLYITGRRYQSSTRIKVTTDPSLSGGTELEKLDSKSDFNTDTIELQKDTAYYIYCSGSGMDIQKIRAEAIE